MSILHDKTWKQLHFICRITEVKSNWQKQKCTAMKLAEQLTPTNGWVQICCSSKKKEQILIQNIKPSCSPNSSLMLTARDSITVWQPPQMSTMFSAVEDKELAVNAFTVTADMAKHNDLIQWFTDVSTLRPNKTH